MIQPGYKFRAMGQVWTVGQPLVTGGELKRLHCTAGVESAYFTESTILAQERVEGPEVLEIGTGYRIVGERFEVKVSDGWTQVKDCRVDALAKAYADLHAERKKDREGWKDARISDDGSPSGVSQWAHVPDQWRGKRIQIRLKPEGE